MADGGRCGARPDLLFSAVVLKWLGLTVIAAAAADALQARSRPAIWVQLAACGQSYPATAALGSGIAYIQGRWRLGPVATRSVEASLLIALGPLLIPLNHYPV